MKANEFIDPAQQRVNAMRQQAKDLQKRTKEAALQLELQKDQQRLSQLNAKTL